jgi:hypothetical protein
MKLWRNLNLQIAFVRETLKIQKSNWIYSLASKIILFCFVVSVGLIIWRHPLLPPQIPLWYSQAWGTDRLAGSLWIFLLPVSSLLWYFIDVILSIYVTRDHYTFSQVLFVSSLFVAVFSLITVANILFLVT